jgi:hypothetical protein
MSECITETTSHFSPCASLAAIGLKIKDLDLLGPIERLVQIEQKTVKYRPSDKLMDAFITILAGAHGLVEINTRLKSDSALQAAFGRTGCADQSVVQQTLNSSTTKNVTQMQQAITEIYRQHSQGYRHDYQADWQVLDADMSGMPCGPKAAFATKGYFAKQRNRRGRQLGRVLASRYDEVVVDQLFDGKTQLAKALQPLIEQAEEILQLDSSKRVRTIVRLDSGGGSLDDVNWLLERGYQVHCKDYSGKSARKLAKSVKQWFDDPKQPSRQLGWVTEAPKAYVRPVVRIAVRCRKQDGKWAIGVLISALSPEQVLALMRQPLSSLSDPVAVLLAYVNFYDQRGGGVETSLKGDKQGLGITSRNKKRFEAQQILVLLGSLAHNVIVWARQWLSQPPAKLQGYGMLRMVRDVFHVSGFLLFDQMSHVFAITLNKDAPLAHTLVKSLCELLTPLHIAVQLGQT